MMSTSFLSYLLASLLALIYIGKKWHIDTFLANKSKNKEYETLGLFEVAKFCI